MRTMGKGIHVAIIAICGNVFLVCGGLLAHILITFVTCANSFLDKNARYIYQAVLDRVYLPEN